MEMKKGNNIGMRWRGGIRNGRKYMKIENKYILLISKKNYKKTGLIL